VTVGAQPLLDGLPYGEPIAASDDVNVFGESPGLDAMATVAPAFYRSVGEAVVATTTFTNNGNVALVELQVTANRGTVACEGVAGVFELAPGESVSCTTSTTVQTSDVVAPTDSIVVSTTLSGRSVATPLSPAGRPIELGSTVVADALVAVDDQIATPYDTVVVGSLSSNDVVPPGSTFAVVASPSSGVITAFDSASGAVTYDPPAGFVGQVTFGYRVCAPAPAAAECTTATAVVDVDPPDGARAALSAVVGRLQQLGPSLDDKAAKRVDKALDHLRTAISGSWWTGSDTLDPRQGHRAFVEMSNAVKQLTQIWPIPPAVADEVDAVVSVARVLATDAIDAARARNGNVWRIWDAVIRVAAGDVLAKIWRSDRAINEYRHAWERATSA
jgi:hypothetical protein